MTIVYPDIGAHLRRLGRVFVFTGDVRAGGYDPNGLRYVGATEGIVTANLNAEMNETRFEEEMGPAVVEADLMGYNPVVNVPLILHNLEEQQALLSPEASPSAGSFGHIPVSEKGLLLVSIRHFPAGGLSYDGNTFNPEAFNAQNCFMITRGYWFRTQIGYQQADGNKRVEEFEYRGMVDLANDVPQGLRSFIVGNWHEQGFTAARL